MMSGSLICPALVAGRAAGSHIRLKVVGQEIQEVRFKVKLTTLMHKLMKSYSDRVGIPEDLLRFRFDGKRIERDSTPLTLELIQDDVIEVFQEQAGGGPGGQYRYVLY
jgi:small ubiquitin-related modifier